MENKGNVHISTKLFMVLKKPLTRGAHFSLPYPSFQGRKTDETWRHSNDSNSAVKRNVKELILRAKNALRP